MASKKPRAIEVVPSGLMDTVLLAQAPKSAPKSDGAPPEQMMLPGVTHIGRGFDVIHGNYATATSTMEQLFDINERIGPDDYSEAGDDDFRRSRANAYAACERLYGKATYGMVEVEPTIGGEASKYTWSGSRVSSVQTKVNAAAKVEASYGTFSGELEVMGSSSQASSASSYFCEMLGRFPKYVLRLKPQNDDLWALLLPKVQDALSNWPAEKLKSDFFPRYGGYYLHNAVVGGCVKYWAVRTTTSSESSKSFETKMKASYKYGVGEAKGEAHVAGEKTDKEFQENSENALFARGGTSFPDFGTVGAVNTWIETILDAPELIDFDNGNGDGCRPVWSLIKDSARAKLVQEAFAEYARANGKEFDGLDPDIKPLYGFKDWKSHDLHRWFYSRDRDHARGKEWGNAHHTHIGVYPSSRFGVSKFTSVSKEISRGLFSGKHRIYKIVKGGVPKGWTKVSTFYAPTAALDGSLDTWVPIYEYTRTHKGDQCGKHYNTKNAKVGSWKRGAKPLFYAARK